jgi:hypothetical protein
MLGLRAGLLPTHAHAQSVAPKTLLKIIPFLALLLGLVPMSVSAAVQPPPPGVPNTIQEVEDNGLFSGVWTWNGTGYKRGITELSPY